jgi:uncharacterized glyoxalase superfamily protein PhnB
MADARAAWSRCRARASGRGRGGRGAPVQTDAPAATAQAVRKGPVFLYVEVENLDETMGVLKDVEVVMPVRTTFYGAREIGVKEPAGHFVTFAQTGAAPQK